MTSKSKILVFDLDGTLVDSALDLVPALNKTTAMEGVPPISISEAGFYVGQGALKMIERAFEVHKVPLKDDRKQELFSVFLDHYGRHVADETKFYDGVLESLAVLKKQGWQFAVCTNKFEELAKAILTKLGEAEQFPIVAGGDTFEYRKPSPKHILETIRLAGGDPNRAIVIGDSFNDTSAAQAAEIPVIAVDFGYSDIPVEDLKPNEIISHFSQLPEAVKRIETGQRNVQE